MKNTVNINGREYKITAREDFGAFPLAKADNNRRGIAAMLTLEGKRGAIKLAYETMSGEVRL